MENKFEIKRTFNVEPFVLYHAWLDSEIHSKMTGGQATCSTKENENFSVWDGYISGKNIKLIKDQQIVQTWRTSDFKEADNDSEIVINLKSTDAGTELALIHSKIPDGQPDYEQGWEEHYFSPMKEYFG